MQSVIFHLTVSHVEPNKTLCVTMETEADPNPSIWNQVCVFTLVAVETVPLALWPIHLCSFGFCLKVSKANYCTSPAGIYGLSNSLLDSPWRKVLQGKSHFSSVVSDQSLSCDGLVQELLNVLNNEELWVVTPYLDVPSLSRHTPWKVSFILVWIPSCRHTSAFYRYKGFGWWCFIVNVAKY